MPGEMVLCRKRNIVQVAQDKHLTILTKMKATTLIRENMRSTNYVTYFVKLSLKRRKQERVNDIEENKKTSSLYRCLAKDNSTVYQASLFGRHKYRVFEKYCNTLLLRFESL
jgi:uncharacterized membrane protein YheB (UPF0754 family)